MDRVTSLELQIDELVVEGLRPSDRGRLTASLSRELDRLFSERGVPPGLGQSRRLERLATAPIRLPPAAGAARLGTAVARAIYRELSR